MLEIILTRLKPQVEKIIAEEQAGFRAGGSTTEQIFNLCILCEKYLRHQQDLSHVFIDFKKAFDRVWHAALWATMRKYNISTNPIQDIKNFCNKATSAILFNSSIFSSKFPSNCAKCGSNNAPTFLKGSNLVNWVLYVNSGPGTGFRVVYHYSENARKPALRATILFGIYSEFFWNELM